MPSAISLQGGGGGGQRRRRGTLTHAGCGHHDPAERHHADGLAGRHLGAAHPVTVGVHQRDALPQLSGGGGGGGGGAHSVRYGPILWPDTGL